MSTGTGLSFGVQGLMTSETSKHGKAEQDGVDYPLEFSEIKVTYCSLFDAFMKAALSLEELGILLPNNQRQHRTWHVQKDVLPYALCSLSNRTV